MICAAPAPEDRWRHSKRSPDQSPVVVAVRRSQSDGHGPARLPTPLGQVFDGEDARESEDGPGRADAELGAAAIEGSLAEPQTRSQFRDDRGTNGKVDSVTEDPAGARTPDLFDPDQEMSGPLLIDAPKNY